MYVIKNQNKQKEWHPATKPLLIEKNVDNFERFSFRDLEFCKNVLVITIKRKKLLKHF